VFVDDTEPYVFEWQNRRVGKFVFTVTAKRGDGEAVESRGVEFEFVAKRRADEVVLIAEGSRWLYLDTGEPPDEQWTGAGFDDAYWLEGRPNWVTAKETRLREFGSAKTRGKSTSPIGSEKRLPSRLSAVLTD